MTVSHLLDVLAKFEKARVLVVGDIYLDENVYGAMTGISLEAPIPIFEVSERRYNPGAAGNAACNVAALGATTYMVGVVGDDMNAEIVKREFALRNVDTSGVVTHPTWATNTYGKLRAGGFNIPEQEVLRTDTPTAPFISGAIEDQVIANIEARAADIDAIVVTDQVCSVATKRVLGTVAKLGREKGILTVGDSRERIGEFEGFDVVVPNDREAGIGVDIDVVDRDSLTKAGVALCKRVKNAMVTCGPDGITLFAEDGRTFNAPTMARHVADVTGAGDTVTATVALTLVAGGSYEDAAVLGNAAAAVAVAQKGVVTVSRGEVEEILTTEGTPAKVQSVEQLVDVVKRLQNQGKRVVWTNGCFDILHAGHITYLLKAASEGDILIVGLNSDASVSAIKGPDRPIVQESERALIISALECVDYVTIFSEPSPLPIIERLQPDVYTKGGDYSIDTIDQNERKVVEGYGGSIAIIKGVDGRSTTDIVTRITAGKKE